MQQLVYDTGSLVHMYTYNLEMEAYLDARKRCDL